MCPVRLKRKKIELSIMRQFDAMLSEEVTTTLSITSILSTLRDSFLMYVQMFGNIVFNPLFESIPRLRKSEGEIYKSEFVRG